MKQDLTLRSWSSKSCCLRSITIQDKTNDPNATVNVLGLRWNTLKDTISFTPRSFHSLTSTLLVTKREILRDSAQIYDPLGLLAPVTVKAKILVQTLWKQKIDWDEPLDQELTSEWSTIAEDIKEATTITYPRLYFALHNQLLSAATQLHVFTDVSLKAYGGECIYDKIILLHWWCPDLESLPPSQLLFLDWNLWLQLLV